MQMAHWIVIAYDEKCTSHDIEDNVNDNAHVIHNCIEADTAAEACEKARKEMEGVYEDLQAYRLYDFNTPKFDKTKDKIYLWRIMFETEDGRQYSEDDLGVEIPDGAAQEIDEMLKEQGVPVDWKWEETDEGEKNLTERAQL
jgi:hypothetical protein